MIKRLCSLIALRHNLFTLSKNYLDCNLDCDLDSDIEDVPVYTGHSLFNTTKHITFLFIVQSLLHSNPPDIWIKIIEMECLHMTKFFQSRWRSKSGTNNIYGNPIDGVMRSLGAKVIDGLFT